MSETIEQKFLEGQKIEKDFDPSIGCSIKWKEQQILNYIDLTQHRGTYSLIRH